MDGKTDSSFAQELALPHLRFEVVDETYESQLRALLNETSLGGNIEVTLRRDPNYFHGAVVEGSFHQVLAARDEADTIVAMATRSIRNRYVNGVPKPVGYLGGLRIRQNSRKGLVIARGFEKLRQLHCDGRAEYYLTTVSAGNSLAIDTLTKGRAHVPNYHFLGKYLTFVVPSKAWKRQCHNPDLKIGYLTEHDMPELLAFLDREGRSRLFFPVLNPDDFESKFSTFRDLSGEQIFCARRDGRIVGTLAGWDQSAFKQSRIERYNGRLKWSRFIYNAFATCVQWPRFPAPGQQLRSITLALPVIENADQDVWLSLLQAIRQSPAIGNIDSLLLGLFERDPLVPLIKESAVHCYETLLYVVSWMPDKVQPCQFESRNVYLELGCL